MQNANSICFTPCSSTTNTAAIGVSLTGDATATVPASSTSCLTDFLTLLDQTVFNSGVSSGLSSYDRTCGVVPATTTGQSICCKYTNLNNHPTNLVSYIFYIVVF